jgi:tetratricopeptide (TPR) repeat protein
MSRGLLSTLFLATLIVASAWPEHGEARSRRSATARKAKKHFKAGKAAYAEGKFQEAAKHFSAGYMLDPKPGFLLNIAQSYRKAGEPKEALHYYREYLSAAPESRLRPQVEGLIKEIEEEIKPKPEPKPEPEAKEAPAAAVDMTPPPPSPKEDPFYKKWWFWTSIAVVVGAGIGVGVYAANQEPDYVKEGGLGSVSW